MLNQDKVIHPIVYICCFIVFILVQNCVAAKSTNLFLLQSLIVTPSSKLSSITTMMIPFRERRRSLLFPRLASPLLSKTDDLDTDDNTGIVFQEISIADEFDERFLEEMERDKPSEWLVMKEILGINIFTFILAVLIVFFLSMNAFLGPGWLGGALGFQGTGTFEEVSPSLPGTLDLNKQEFRL